MKYGKILVWSGVVSLAVALGVLFFAERRPVPPERPIGAVSGPEISGNEFTVGGVTYFTRSQTFNNGTSTVCALRKPDYATTTLEVATVVWSATNTPAGNAYGDSASTTVSMDIYKITEGDTNDNAFATSSGTALASNIAWDGARTMVLIASTTAVNGSMADAGAEDGTEIWDSQYQYFVVKTSVAGAGDYDGYYPLGFCTATWRVISK